MSPTVIGKNNLIEAKYINTSLLTNPANYSDENDQKFGQKNKDKTKQKAAYGCFL